MPDQEIPLIWTVKGNLPIASLKLDVRWEKTGDYTKMIETYSLDGEVVRESAHVLMHRGLELEVVAQPIS